MKNNDGRVYTKSYIMKTRTGVAIFYADNDGWPEFRTRTHPPDVDWLRCIHNAVFPGVSEQHSGTKG